jgi:hypothetical protein
MESLYKAWVEYVKEILYTAPDLGQIPTTARPPRGAKELTFRSCPSARPGKLWSQSQMPGRHINRLRRMGVKYYTHFVLTGEVEEGSDQEFSGVVEVNQATERRFETQEIEALLARNFDIESGEVRLINWARLQ